ncbi:hypothetical protein COCOBI_14-4250 [Coccomyxa sp. Obi]|nr:hypothetical protein COCOBI_14-4250 [Coccomyxa sp. Obi]
MTKFREGLEMTSEEGGSAQLPVEIWEQIAGHMSSRSWAKVSRTCKAMQSVRPEHIDIGLKKESALAWVQTHWGQASTLKLTWRKKNVPWVMFYNAASPTSLRHLEVRLLEEKSPATAMVLTWLLAQAPQLQLLFVQRHTAIVVPPIRNLSHLIMVSSKFNRTTAASIRQLRNLRTLWLGIPDPDPDIPCAELYLASLPHLSDVCINSLAMPFITLPRHCRLHLMGDDLDIFLDTWDDIARHGKLRSVNVQICREVIDDIPKPLLEWKCSFLEWYGIKQLGQVSSPVLFDAAHLCCLTHLNLKGGNIHIILPQELLLQVLHVNAELLSMVCANPQEQAKRLQQVKVVYRTLQGTDVFLLVYAMYGMGAIASKVDGLEASTDSDGCHELLVSYRREPVVWKCPCGACLDCLQQI